EHRELLNLAESLESLERIAEQTSNLLKVTEDNARREHLEDGQGLSPAFRGLGEAGAALTAYVGRLRKRCIIISRRSDWKTHVRDTREALVDLGVDGTEAYDLFEGSTTKNARDRDIRDLRNRVRAPKEEAIHP